jgi:tocopherol O-methyltransferase
MDDYASWMEQAGLKVECCLDWTEHVRRTWQICGDRVHKSRIRWIAPLFGSNSASFIDRFKAILDAYDSGAMKYGCFVARKPQ